MRATHQTGSKTLVVTGVDGFIARHLAHAAAARGWRVVGLHRSGPDRADVTEGPGIERVACDLLDPGACGELDAAMEGADAVVHAAARVQMFGPHGPLVRENSATTRHVLRAAERAGAPRMVFLSSASVLFEAGDQPGLLEVPAPETRALSAYSASKRASEALVQGYPGSWAILRPQAVVGPGDRCLLPPVLDAARRGPWRWIGARDAASVDLVSVRTLVDYVLRAAKGHWATGIFHVTNGEVRPIEALLRGVLGELGIDPGEARISRTTAMGLARALEVPLGWLAPRREPPLTRFAVEMLTRTRTLDRRRTLAAFGEPTVSLDEELERTVQWLARSEVAS